VTLQQVFVDDFGDEIAFSNLSNDVALDSKSDERVTFHAVLGEYSSFGNEWRLIFTGSALDILQTPFTLTEVETLIGAWLPTVLPQALLGTLVLPANFELIPEVLITWSTDLEGLIEIFALEEGETHYETTVFLPIDDTEGTLTATIHYGEEEPF
jgi:hypothetical protein